MAMAMSTSDAILIPADSSIHSIRGALNTSKIESKATKYILRIDQFTDKHEANFSEAIVIDALIPLHKNIDSAISQKRSVLTIEKNSDFAQAYREAAYSLLEHLKFF
jgi:MinD-like ATPase involved in chromosome partitioning or flagellar assembly